MAEPTKPFEIGAPLAPGTSVLEASAGTGKTWTIAAIAAKLVAEGTALERLLLVTFTRAATSELRERIRTRLISVGRGLEAKASGHTPAVADVVVELLADCDPAELDLRRRRITRALADFDAATITTIHGFCQEVLGGLGVLGDLDPGYEFSDDLSELTGQISDDLYVWKFRGSEEPELTPAEAREVAKAAMSTAEVPLAAAAGKEPELRRRLAEKSRELFDARKRRMRTLGYDDLLTRLVAALRDEHAAAVAERVGARWDVVLVDEFQDTDPLQWEIVRAAFAERGATLVLVGDPKQAIYAFRGADVFAYLQAAEAAGSRPTLDTNFRSDQPLIDAYDALFGNAQLGHPGIAYRPVQAPDHHRGRGLRGAPVEAPLRFRLLQRGRGFRLTNRGEIRNADADDAVVADVAADVVELLSSGARVREAARRGAGVEAEVDVMPRHVAVLVRANRQASAIRDALSNAGVPAVINGAGSVFGTETAQEWRRLLVALDRPSSHANARSAALTSFFGWSSERLAAADDLELIHRRLHRYARVLRERGVAAMVEKMNAVEGIPERLLALDDGERRLTDLRHIAQLLHAEAVNEGRGLSALTAWLYRQVSESGGDITDERSRRLDSDEEAVQVLTIHRSKGLEFPIVYAPFLWTAQRPGDTKPVTFHDGGGTRMLDVSLDGDDYYANRAESLREDRGEELRLAYVALTRARHQAVVWFAPGRYAGDSPISRLLMSREPDGTIPVTAQETPSDEAVVARIEELDAQSGGAISAEVIPLPAEEAAWNGPAHESAELEAAEFDRGLDSLWRRNSYSSIAAAAHEAWVASEPEREPELVDDEPEGDEEQGVVAATAGPEGEALPSLWAELPGGRQFGTLIHSIFERIDFAVEDLEAELAAVVAGQLDYHRMEIDADALAAALVATIETPLGPVADGRSLRTVSAGDRLDELSFELPLVGGDRPTGILPVSAIGELLAERLPADDPLARYARSLSEAELGRAVRGYLTGSIDLALRLGGAGGEDGPPRFLIVDYKTNFVGAVGEELTSWQYRPEAIAAAMERGHYWLQALLYLVALHRYLRWRLPGYDPDVNLGGVLYLFVRGMAGPGTPVYDGGDGAPAGVAGWTPPAGVIEALSKLLDAGSG